MVTWTLVELDRIDSTQSVARDLASQGAPEGTVVLAKTQTSGVGRLGRRWSSPEGGLYMSFILRPGGIPQPELASLVAAVAAIDGVRRSTGLSPTVRWPNDIMVGAKKLGGVIAEAQASRHGITEAVIGVGVNCSTPPPQIEDPRGEATSIAEALGKPVAIPELGRSILASFSILYERWKKGEDMREVWGRSVATPGKRVRLKLKTDETPFTATANRIRRDGALIVSRETLRVAVRPEDLEWLRELGQ